MIRAAFPKPLPAPATDFDRSVLDAFIKAGRDEAHIREVYRRLTAEPQLMNERRVVDEYFRGALARIGMDP
jgi:hypothetical protein